MKMKTPRNARSRRGSALVLVVAVLAILAVFSLSLGYSSSVEMLATRNWTNGVQARMAAATGVALAPTGPLTGPLSLASAGPSLAGLNTQGNDSAGLSSLKPLTIALRPDDVRRQTFTTASGIVASRTVGPENPWADAKTRIVYRDASDAMAAIALQDTSAKININAIVPQTEPISQKTATGAATAPQGGPQAFWSESALARFIDRTLQAKHVAGVNAALLAHSIALRRYGADRAAGKAGYDDNGNGDAPKLSAAALRNALTIDHDGLDNNSNGRIDEPGEGTDEPAESATDPRATPAGDDRPYTSLVELMSVPGMTPEAYSALAPYLTVFSSSFAAMDLTDVGDGATLNEGFPQVDPNTASPEMIFDVLRRRFPKAPDALLAQFAVNMVDRRDADNTPTAWNVGGKTYLGLEETPLINEVCSDVPSIDGQADRGQFIELYNPYDRSMSLDGWSLTGGGPAVQLRGSLPPGGFLVVTDLFNNPDAQDTNLGSFFRIFGTVATGQGRQLQQAPALNLPDDAGEIRLLDAQGKTIDDFKYAGGRWNGATRSFQRSDPRVRSAELASATPLADNRNVEGGVAASAALQIQERWQNKPFSSPLDAMLVSSAFSLSADSQRVSGGNEDWAMPELRAETDNRLDAGLVDCFRVGAEIPSDAPLDAIYQAMKPRTSLTALGGLAANGLETIGPLGKLQIAGASIPDQPACATVFGNLNLNTAPAATLAALPGMTDSLLGRLIAVRTQRISGNLEAAIAPVVTPDRPAWWAEIGPFVEPVWRNPSDLLKDDAIWQDRSLYDRLNAVYPFFPLVATHSMSLRSLAANREAPPEGGSDAARRQTFFTDERILAGDRGAVETVRFNFYGRGTAAVGDPDLRYSHLLGSDPALMSPKALIAAATGH